jgi:hypothetical protein
VAEIPGLCFLKGLEIRGNVWQRHVFKAWVIRRPRCKSNKVSKGFQTVYRPCSSELIVITIMENVVLNEPVVSYGRFLVVVKTEFNI